MQRRAEASTPGAATEARLQKRLQEAQNTTYWRGVRPDSSSVPESMRYGSFGAPPTLGTTPSVDDGFVRMTQAEYQKLVSQAMGVSGNNFASQQDIDQLSKPYEGRFEVDVKRQVMMPYYDQVTSKVTGYDKEQAIEKREMQVTEVVPVEKFKTVDETVVEIQEKEKKGTRLVWKQVPEEYTYTVKEPVTVVRPRKIPFTDYEERVVTKTVEVPVERKVLKEGYRTDEVLKGKMVEVKQKEVYEMKPHLVGSSEMQMAPKSDGRVIGITRVGKEVFPGTALDIAKVPKGYSAANADYLSTTERKRRTLSMNTPAAPTMAPRNLAPVLETAARYAC